MKIISMILVVLCVMLPLSTITVYAEEPTTIITEATADEAIKEATLTDINNNLIIIEFTLIFMVMIHFSEKWLKVYLTGNKDSGRVN